MTALLEVRGVSLAFGGLQALGGVTLDVPEGDIVGLIGPNGAGKTTLFNVISGLYRPDTGTIVLGGSDVTHLATHRRAHLGVARSFQNLGLMQDESVAVNVKAAMHRSAGYADYDVVLRPWRFRHAETVLDRRCHSALLRYGLAELAATTVSDLPFAKARLVELAAIAAAMPRLMLLDEPTTGLGIGEIELLERVLTDIHEAGTTVLVVAHDVGFVMRMCDYVYVLAEGKLLSEGRPREVQTDPRVIEAYLGKSA